MWFRKRWWQDRKEGAGAVKETQAEPFFIDHNLLLLFLV